MKVASVQLNPKHCFSQKSFQKYIEKQVFENLNYSITILDKNLRNDSFERLSKSDDIGRSNSNET